MQRRFRYVMASVACSLLVAVASCDGKAPTAPTPPATSPSTNRLPIVSLTIAAPSEIAPGASVQLTATAGRADGSAENVTSQVIWTVGAIPGSPSSALGVLEIGASGLATGRNRGEVFARADLAGAIAMARVLVLPEGTFLLSGGVHEGGVGLANSTVTVTAGVGEGLTASTDSYGQYALFGVSGSVALRTQTVGYLDTIQQLVVTAHRSHSIAMVADRPRSDFSGTYTLTISTQSECGSFPESARRRTYTASVRQDGQGQLFTTLSDADFSVHSGYGQSFFGRVTSHGDIRFWISEDYYYNDEYEIAERFGDTALLVEGTVSTRGTPDVISGSLSGRIIVAGTPAYPFTPFGATCATDRFEMVRR